MLRVGALGSLGAENQVSKGVPRPRRLLLSAISLTASIHIFLILQMNDRLPIRSVAISGPQDVSWEINGD